MMKYYKRNGDVFAFEADGSQDDYIEKDMVKMTDNEVTVYYSEDESLRYDSETDSIVVDAEAAKEFLEKNRRLVWEKVKELRDEKIAGGVFIDTVGKSFHSDEASKVEYSRLGMNISLGIFVPVNWKAMDGEFVKMTEDLFKEIQVKLAKQTDELFAKAEYHKVMIWSTDDPLKYDYTQGW